MSKEEEIKSLVKYAKPMVINPSTN